MLGALNHHGNGATLRSRQEPSSKAVAASKRKEGRKDGRIEGKRPVQTLMLLFYWFAKRLTGSQLCRPHSARMGLGCARDQHMVGSVGNVFGDIQCEENGQ